MSVIQIWLLHHEKEDGGALFAVKNPAINIIRIKILKNNRQPSIDRTPRKKLKFFK